MDEVATGMTTAGWVFLVTAWAGVTALMTFCFYKVLHITPTESDDGGEDDKPG